MERENANEQYVRLLENLQELVKKGLISPESLMNKIRELAALTNSRIPQNTPSKEELARANTPEEITELLSNVLSHHDHTNDQAIDRQSLSVRLKQINGDRTTIKDERIRHTDNGGLHSDVEQAIIISCEGKRIEAHRAEGICEVTGKLAQRALTCRLCHRSICVRHCDFIEQDGVHYPYCNTPPPRSRISCARKRILSTDTWHESERKARNRRHQ